LQVQARLLARQTCDEIQGATKVSAAAIESYEALFFNVTDRLDAPDWICGNAIGWWRFDPLRGRDRPTIFRAYSYFGGPLVLNAIQAYLLGDQHNHAPDICTPAGRLQRSIWRAVETDRLPWDAATAWKLCRLHAQVLERDRHHPQDRPQGAGSVPERLAGFVAEILRDLPDDVGAGRQDATLDNWHVA
jgi:hypothetical protein